MYCSDSELLTQLIEYIFNIIINIVKAVTVIEIWMNMDSGKTVVLAALGRPFSLGMLYDCRNDSLIPGK
ncbi:unnamed protein product [Gadus morhua 'NCC']